MRRNIFDLKKLIVTPLLKLMIKHPKLMESKIFLKAMLVFPDKLSGSYDSMITNSGIDFQTALKTGLNMVKNHPEKILDICTGTGFATFIASEHFPHASITGLDQSRKMIDIANGKVKPMDTIRIKFELGNAARLPYKDESYDLVITSNAPIYLSEANRVLKQNGMIVITFSFGGKAFAKAEEEVSKLMNQYGFSLLDLKSIGKGALILGQKLN